LFICEKCGKEHDGSFGSGRFCSKSCANSRKHSEESRLKTSKSLLSYYENHDHVNKGKIFNPNSERVKRKLQILSGEYVPKRVRKSKKKDCFYMSFKDNGKTYTILCYDNVYTPSSGMYTNVESKVGKILVSKKQ
jgi:hypothetical protein